MAHGLRRFNGLPGFVHVMVEIADDAQSFGIA
jgi:hypothetical protein